uniref:Putative head tail connector protein n=1 Tax=viral metagenome TaxID=1070528 RepID=A0A6M3L1P8_9ZZZZ
MLLTDDEIAAQIKSDVTWASNFRQPRIEDWNAYYRLYKNYVNAKDVDTAANVAIPTAFSLVEVQTAFLIDMIMEGGHFVEVLGRTPQGQASAKAIRDLIDYHFQHSISTYELLEDYIRQLLIYGTSVLRVDWDFRPGWMRRMRPYVNEDGEIAYKPKLAVEILKNAPSARVVDIYHFLHDPNAACIEDCRFVAEEMWIDPSTLREKESSGNGWRNVDNVIQGNMPTVNFGLNQRLGEIDLSGHQNANSEQRGKVPIVDYWGYLTKGWNRGTLGKNAKTVLYHVIAGFTGGEHNVSGGMPVILFSEETPFFHNRFPYIDARLNAPLGEFYGSGDIEFCESLLEEQRDIRNSLLENISQTTNRMFVRRRGAGIDPAQLTWRPAGVIDVNEQDDIRVLDPGSFDPAVFRTQEDLRRDIEQVTGINDFVMGQHRSSTGFNDTATGISLIQEAAMKRLGHKGQVIQRAIRSTAQMVFTLIAQFQPYDQSIRVLDNESATRYRFLDISREALQNQYDFNVVNAPALGSKPMRQNQMIQLYQLASDAKTKDPAVTIDLDRLMKRIIDELDIPNSNELFGFDQLDKTLQMSGLGGGMSDENVEERMPPDEENRLMVEQNQAVVPNLRDHHPHHMHVHAAMYDNLPENTPARALIEQHYRIHAEMAKTTKNLIGNAMAVETMGQGIRNLNYINGGTNSSPNQAGGRESMVRGSANAAAGNA